MKLKRAGVNENFDAIMKQGGAYLDFSHVSGDKLLREIDKLLKPFGVELHAFDTDDSDGYIVQVKKRSPKKRK